MDQRMGKGGYGSRKSIRQISQIICDRPMQITLLKLLTTTTTTRTVMGFEIVSTHSVAIVRKFRLQPYNYCERPRISTGKSM